MKVPIQYSDWSARIIAHASIEDLDLDAIAYARAQFSTKYPRLSSELKDWSDKVFLDRAGLTIQGKITHTAILLLGKPESDNLIYPASSRISWILKGTDGLEKDYAHFGCPMLLTVKDVISKIRILKCRFLKPKTLFPTEVEQYDPFIITELLCNSMAYQDYKAGVGITVIENNGGTLTFTNAGKFTAGNIQDVVLSDTRTQVNRHPFLVNAMTHLNMMEAIGGGIKHIFDIQRKKCFPLPDYDMNGEMVRVTITGKVTDKNYVDLLSENPHLSMNEVFLLDKVIKKMDLTDAEASVLKCKQLIKPLVSD